MNTPSDDTPPIRNNAPSMAKKSTSPSVRTKVVSAKPVEAKTKSAVIKPAAGKPTVKKAVPKKAAVAKKTARKPVAKKTSPKKAAVKKTTPKKAPVKTIVRRISKAAVDAPVEFNLDIDMSQAMKSAFATTKAQLDALLKSREIAAKGMREIGQTVMTLTTNVLDANIEVANKIGACKDLVDILKLQSDLANGTYDLWIKETEKISKMSGKVAEDAMAPLSKELKKAIDAATRK